MGKSKARKRFVGKKGWGMALHDADCVGRQRDEFANIPTGHDFTERSMQKDAPCHEFDCYDGWDEKKAARHKWDAESRHLLNSYEIEYRTEDGKVERRVPGAYGLSAQVVFEAKYVSDESDEEHENAVQTKEFVYLTHDQIVGDKRLIWEWLMKSRNEALTYLNRWARDRQLLEKECPQFRDLFVAIENLPELKINHPLETQDLLVSPETRLADSELEEFDTVPTPSTVVENPQPRGTKKRAGKETPVQVSGGV